MDNNFNKTEIQGASPNFLGYSGQTIWITCSDCNFDLNNDHDCPLPVVSIPSDFVTQGHFHHVSDRCRTDSFNISKISSRLNLSRNCVVLLETDDLAKFAHLLPRKTGILMRRGSSNNQIVFKADDGGIYYYYTHFPEVVLGRSSGVNEIYYEQVGEMESEVTNSHPSSTEKPMDVVTDAKVETPSARPLVGSTDTSTDAIEEDNITPGTTSSRKVSVLETPSGPKTVIHMTDSALLKLQTQEYLMAAHPAPWSHVWAPCQIQSFPSKLNILPKFNYKTRLQMLNFSHTNYLGLWKIVAPLPLFSSQRFWVSFAPQDANGDPLQQVGFEWNPSEEPEIYLLTPWTSLNRTDRVVETPRDLISIAPLTDLVFTTGLPTSLDFSAYYTPYELNLYTPTIVAPPEAPSTSNVKVRSEVLINSAPFPLVANEFMVVTQITSGQSVNYGSTTIYDDATQSALLVSGPMSETITFTGTNTPVVTVLSYSSPQTVVTTELTGGLQVDLSTLGNTHISLVGAGELYLGSNAVQYPVSVISTKYILNSNDTVTPNQDISLVSLSPAVVYEEQISGLSYNDSNGAAKQDQGYIGDHTARLDSHWGLLNSLPIASLDDQLIFNVFNPQNGYIFNDLLRHFYFSKYMTLQVRATSVPSANLILRITQHPVGSNGDPLPLEAILQLPGVEYDIKSGDLKLQPYWNVETTVQELTNIQALYYQVDVLGGTISLEPVYISMLINPKNMEYYHLAGEPLTYTPNRLNAITPMEWDEVYEEQIGDPQVMSNHNHSSTDKETLGTVESERRWQYLTSFRISQDTGAVSIPINKNFLGEFFHRHLCRYRLWNGTPRVKLMFTNARIVNGNIHVVQSHRVLPSDSTSIKPYDYLKEVGYSVSGAPDAAIEVDLKWRSKYTSLRTINDGDNLGNLIIVIPEISSGTLAGIPTDVVCTIHIDTADIALKTPIDPSVVSPWTEPTITSAPRAATAIY